MKVCTRCGVLKPLSEFHKHGGEYKGKVYLYRPECKPCRNKSARENKAYYRRGRAA